MLANLLSAAGTAVSVIVGVVAVGIVVFAIVDRILQKKRGKGGCDCGCSGCTGCTGCTSRPPEAKTKEQKK